MSELGTGGMFEGLDDPTPPAFGSDRLPAVLERGHQLRRQRRLAYSIGSACAAVLLAAGAVGIASVGGSHSPAPPTLAHTTSPAPTANPHRSTHAPSAPIGGRHHGGSGSTHVTPPTCVTPTPSPSGSATPSAVAAPTDTTQASPAVNESPVAYDEARPPAAPSPSSDTSCASPSATPTEQPTPTPTPTSTDSPVPPPL